MRVDALRWIVIQLEQEFTRYPISIYSRGVRLLLTFVVPFAFMNYFPARYFLHKAHEGAMLPRGVGLLTPRDRRRARRARVRVLALRPEPLLRRRPLAAQRRARGSGVGRGVARASR